MRTKWQLSKGNKFLVIVRRVDIFPREAASLSIQLIKKDFDEWFANPISRAMLIEVYDSIDGHLNNNHRRTPASESQSLITARLVEAFREGELFAFIIPRSYLTQITSQVSAGADPLEGSNGTAKQQATSWIEIKLRDGRGQPVAREKYLIKFPKGSSAEGQLDEFGQAEFDDIDRGVCQVSFPNLEKGSWWLDEKLATKGESTIRVPTDASHLFVMALADIEAFAQSAALVTASRLALPLCEVCDRKGPPKKTSQSSQLRSKGALV